MMRIHSGPPDKGVAFVYPDMSYFEWTQDGNPRPALDKVLGLLATGDFHGLLGEFKAVWIPIDNLDS